MRHRKILRFFAVFFLFALALAFIQLFILMNSRASLVGYAFFDSEIIEAAVLPFIAVFLLGLVLVFIILRTYKPTPRIRNVPLSNLSRREPIDFDTHI